MRLLKVAAQDRSRNGKADTVVLNFFRRQPGEPDEMQHEAIAVDVSADGQVEVLCSGDINRDGDNDVMDKRLLDVFADTFLQLNWFNTGNRWQRTLVIYAEHFTQSATPDAVRMEFHKHTGVPCQDSLVYGLTVPCLEGDSVPQPPNRRDLNPDALAINADKALIRRLCTTFLGFNWYEAGQVSLS